MIALPLKDIPDTVLRRVAELIQSFINAKALLSGDWKHFEITFTAAATEYRHRHGLPFVPKDVIQTSLTGAGSVTWLYTSFTKDFVYITASGPCKVRAFIGRYSE